MLTARVLAAVIGIALGGYARLLVDAQQSANAAQRPRFSPFLSAILGLALVLPCFALIAAAATWQERLVAFWPYTVSVIGCTLVGGIWGWLWISARLRTLSSISH